MTLLAVGYRLIMVRTSIFITVSVIVGGILGNLITFMFEREYDSNVKIVLC